MRSETTTTTTTTVTRLAKKPVVLKWSSSAPLFSNLTSMKKTRKTTQVKQDERELVLAYKDLRSAAYKVGSNIYQ